MKLVSWKARPRRAKLSLGLRRAEQRRHDPPDGRGAAVHVVGELLPRVRSAPARSRSASSPCRCRARPAGGRGARPRRPAPRSRGGATRRSARPSEQVGLQAVERRAPRRRVAPAARGRRPARRPRARTRTARAPRGGPRRGAGGWRSSRSDRGGGGCRRHVAYAFRSSGLIAIHGRRRSDGGPTAKTRHMRNRDLHDALRDFAVEAAGLLRESLHSGAELEFDLEGGRGDGPTLYHYKPLTPEVHRRPLGADRQPGLLRRGGRGARQRARPRTCA